MSLFILLIVSLIWLSENSRSIMTSVIRFAVRAMLPLRQSAEMPKLRKNENRMVKAKRQCASIA